MKTEHWLQTELDRQMFSHDFENKHMMRTQWQPRGCVASENSYELESSFYAVLIIKLQTILLYYLVFYIQLINVK